MKTKETEFKPGHLLHGFIHCRSSDAKVRKSIGRSVKKSNAVKKIPKVDVLGWERKV